MSISHQLSFHLTPELSQWQSRNMMPNPLARWIETQDPRPTQAQLADRIGISEPFLSQIISGKRAVSLNTAGRISAVTGIPLRAFVRSEAVE